MINDVESNDFHSRSAWLRNSIPNFKVVFFSLHAITVVWHRDAILKRQNSNILRDFTFP